MKKGIRCCIYCLVFAIGVFSIGIIRDKGNLRENVLRLHVVGASNSEEDQQIKLAVKDAVVDCIQKELMNVADMDQAKAYLNENLPKIEAIANQVLDSLGCDKNAVATLAKEIFPIRDYDTFSLPSGIYEAVRIHIGEAQGKNWWCVVFPSLCVPATATEFEDIAAGAGFSEELIHTLAAEDGYNLRFYLLDMLGKVENMFFAG